MNATTTQEQPKEGQKPEFPQVPALINPINKGEEDTKIQKRPRGQPGHLSEIQRQDIMGKIDAGLIAGFSPSTIQKQLKIGKSTFWRLHDRLVQETMKERIQKTDRLVAIYLARTEKLIERLETRYAKTTDPKEWILIAAQINVIVQQTADRLQSMGYLPKRKEELDLTGDVHLSMTARLLKVIHVEMKEIKDVEGKTI